MFTLNIFDFNKVKKLKEKLTKWPQYYILIKLEISPAIFREIFMGKYSSEKSTIRPLILGLKVKIMNEVDAPWFDVLGNLYIFLVFKSEYAIIITQLRQYHFPEVL